MARTYVNRLQVELPNGSLHFIQAFYANSYKVGLYDGVEATPENIAEAKRIKPELRYFRSSGACVLSEFV